MFFALLEVLHMLTAIHKIIHMISSELSVRCSCYITSVPAPQPVLYSIIHNCIQHFLHNSSIMIDYEILKAKTAVLIII